MGEISGDEIKAAVTYCTVMVNLTTGALRGVK